MLFSTGYDRSAITQLRIEASNCGVLDSACSSTVCGRDWLDNYLSSLDEQSKASVKHAVGTRAYGFGGGTVVKSDREYEIPATLVGKASTYQDKCCGFKHSLQTAPSICPPI